MPTYNASSAVNANTTAYAQRLGSKPTFGAPNNSYAVPDVPTPAQLQRRPFTPSYTPPRSNVMPVNDTGFNVQPDNQSTDQGKSFNPGTAFQFTKAAGDSMKMGDGGAHDQTVDMSINKVNGDLQRLGTSENPQAVQQDIENDPWYADNSLWKGIFNAAAATYDGASVSEALAAGQRGIQQGEDEKTQSQMKQNALQNRGELLKQYTADSVANYTLTGNPSMLREKKLTQDEIDQRAQAATANQRAYEEQIHQRDRSEKLEDEQRKAANTPAEYGYAKGVGIYNKRTGLGVDGKPVDVSKDTNALPTKGSLSTSDYNNAVLLTGKDPYTNEPVKAPQLSAAKEWDKARQGYENQKATLDNTIDNISYLLSPDHESDFNSAFGAIDNNLPSTRKGTKIMEGKVETLKSELFLNSIKEMKGMGALSDAEGKKLTNAISALDPNNQGTLKAQLNDIYTIMKAGRERMNKEAQRKGYIDAPVNGALAGNDKQQQSGTDFNNADQWK